MDPKQSETPSVPESRSVIRARNRRKPRVAADRQCSQATNLPTGIVSNRLFPYRTILLCVSNAPALLILTAWCRCQDASHGTFCKRQESCEGGTVIINGRCPVDQTETDTRATSDRWIKPAGAVRCHGVARIARSNRDPPIASGVSGEADRRSKKSGSCHRRTPGQPQGSGFRYPARSGIAPFPSDPEPSTRPN